MSDYLVTINFNWNDEMDIFGYSFMEEDEVNRLKKLLKSKDDMFTFNIGTNEDMEFENGEECLECIDFMKIKNEDEYKVLQKYLGSNECSISPISLLDTLEELKEELNEEDTYSDIDEDYF